MTAPHYADDLVTLHHGDCLDVLRGLPDGSVDAVVTDPPYAINFMGRKWDRFDDGSPFTCEECGNDDATDGYRLCLDCLEAADQEDLRGAAMLGQQSQNWHAKATHSRGYADNNNAAFGRWCKLWTTECLRVLKPGGHLLAFGGTRTWHRLACAVEDAGFEVRDSLAWIYGSGFPKSLNLGKSDASCQCPMGDSTHGPTQGIDPLERSGAGPSLRPLPGAGEAPAEQGEAQRSDVLLSELPEQGPRGNSAGERLRLDRDDSGASLRLSEPGMEGRGDVQAPEGQLRRPEVRPVPTGVVGDGEVRRVRDGAPPRDGAVGGPTADPVGVRQPRQPRSAGQSSGEPRPLADERGPQARRGWPLCGGCGKPRLTGLGTALKPAFEPIVVGRKPLAGTVAANVLAHGTGALNVDGCRVGTSGGTRGTDFRKNDQHAGSSTLGEYDNKIEVIDAGRWPANVVLDDTQAAELDRQSGTLTSGANPTRRGADGDRTVLGTFGGQEQAEAARGADSGGASRFFPTFRYEAKAPTVERPRDGEVAHPTVKPLDLMRWLVRLVTPPGGVVLEPFAGSGTTAEACVIEGFRCIAIEREASYLPLIVQRLTKPIQPDLFGGAA